MIFYFSGTGNSQMVARQVAESLQDELISINYYVKQGRTGSFKSDDPLVFVVPTYSWRIPKLVETWILNSSFAGSTKAYFVLTCGGSVGNAAAYARQLCAKKGFEFCGLAEVLMPENYLALGPTPEGPECEKIMEEAKMPTALLADLIHAGKPFPQRTATLGDRLKSGPVNPLFYSLYVGDKGFRVSQACTSCEKCVTRCTLNNIDLVEGRPVWRRTCTHCMACIGGCPAEAIEYKTVSPGRHRHYVMDDGLCWESLEA